ncbi:MAG: hypothetical protein DMD75_30080 [Candidatus Rokuibacteriota bacterium]|nr:MAG: hypothetical protein DMD75_30080 [Candidatus Rokubacteria bacterium]
MNRRPRSLALLLLFVAFAGCATASSNSGQSSSSSSSPRVRCLTDPARDSASGTRPLFFLFCAESP